MLTITRHRERVEHTAYSRVFEYIDTPGAGFGFPCNAFGHALPMSEVAKENMRKCFSGELPVKHLGVQVSRWVSYRPAEGWCACRRLVVLDGDTACDCGRLYNGVGQELVAPALWGDDTSEFFGAPPREDW